MATSVKVEELPGCDFCSAAASYDAATRLGPWANMCNDHFKQFGIGLGTGVGQRLELSK